MVAKYVDESKFEDKTRIRVGGSLKSKSGEAEEFNPTPEECKTISQWLTKNNPELLERRDESDPFFEWSEKDAFKPIVLLPRKLGVLWLKYYYTQQAIFSNSVYQSRNERGSSI